MISLEEIRKFTTKSFARSSGPGGQNVNKTETKVFLDFDIEASTLSDFEKQKLMRKFPNGVIHISNQETRSQHRNVEQAFEHLEEVILENLIEEKERKKKKHPHLTRAGKLRKMLKDKLMRYRKRYLPPPEN